MAVDYTLLMQKTHGDGTWKESLKDFGFAVCSIPWPETEIKELATRDWPGEDGEDTYIPTTLKVEAYNLSVEMIYKGAVGERYAAYTKFRDFLLGISVGGAEMRIYDPYNNIGRQGVYVKAISSVKSHKDNAGEYLAFTLELRVTDPLTDINLTIV